MTESNTNKCNYASIKELDESNRFDMKINININLNDAVMRMSSTNQLLDFIKLERNVIYTYKK
jgi:hypothetical protein